MGVGAMCEFNISMCSVRFVVKDVLAAFLVFCFAWDCDEGVHGLRWQVWVTRQVGKLKFCLARQ